MITGMGKMDSPGDIRDWTQVFPIELTYLICFSGLYIAGLIAERLRFVCVGSVIGHKKPATTTANDPASSSTSFKSPLIHV